MKKNENRLKIVLFILLATIFLVLSLLVDEDTSLNKVQNDVKVQEKVNTHLQITNKKIEQQKNIRNMEMQRLPEVGQSIVSEDYQNNQELDFSPDRNEIGVIQDLESTRKDFSGYHSPQAKVQNEVKQQDLALQNRKQDMVEYVRKFKENARRHGYIIEVDENYIVKSVKKAPVTDNNKQLLDPSLSGSK